MTKRILSIMSIFALIMSFNVLGNENPQQAEVLGQGYIAKDSGTSVLIDVSAPTNILWYVNEDGKTTGDLGQTYYKIECLSQELVNNSKMVNLNVKVIDYKNTSGEDALDAVPQAKVTLNLTGQLSEDGYGQDMFAKFANPNAQGPDFGLCSQILASENGVGSIGDSTWDIGFEGSYNDALLPASVKLSDYTLYLEFSVYSISN